MSTGSILERGVVPIGKLRPRREADDEALHEGLDATAPAQAPDGDEIASRVGRLAVDDDARAVCDLWFAAIAEAPERVDGGPVVQRRRPVGGVHRADLRRLQSGDGAAPREGVRQARQGRA